MNDAINRAFNQLLDAFVQTCRNHFDQNLVGIILFGAHREYFVHTQRDVDLLVVCRDLPDSGWERYDIVMQLLEAMESSRTQMQDETGYSLYLSPVLKSLKEMNRLKKSMQELIARGRILHDADGHLNRLLQSFRENLDQADD